MELNTEILARIQFAFSVSFHYIFPPLSIGLGLLMVFFEAAYLRSKNIQYHQLAHFWTKIFAVTFGIGVVTGIVMEFEFGTNWAAYSRFVGDVFGSALAAEGIFAFALESGFLGILLFGWNRVKPWVHFVSTLGVFFGSMFSAVWIVVANSWQQTPAGFKIVGEGFHARAEITDFWAMVFNPSSVERLLHVWVGAFLSGAFLVLSVHSYYLIKNRHIELSKIAIKIALIIATIGSLSQLFIGHLSAEGVAKIQPAKLAAFEGHFISEKSADLYLFGWVDQENQRVLGPKIPGGLSFLIHGNFDSKITGLDKFGPGDKPTQINAIFQFYHLMVGLGMIMIGLSLLGSYFYFKGRLFQTQWLLKIFVIASIAPQLANQFGWFAAEMGRQPWVVYGLLKTSNAFSESVTSHQILFSIILFFIVYAFLFVLFIYMMNKKIQHGPDDESNIESRPMTQEIANLISGEIKGRAGEEV
ncbi:MAG: cytochrome ubiquinol oxidase subunit I [Halobacteriovoraceae bacterium]|nr:cytochrome ubiquinol oxidase subunit I [Halobacteriovoraceae bacterium]|tara:strand:+ start:8413 stop:9825 length:1413 start_codon:yes stop_codon:yes gene_type:complete